MSDIPPALAKTAFNLSEGNDGFVVHWLNNKEFHFTCSIEVFMKHLRELADEQTRKAENDFGDWEEELAAERVLHMKLEHGW